MRRDVSSVLGFNGHNLSKLNAYPIPLGFIRQPHTSHTLSDNLCGTSRLEDDKPLSVYFVTICPPTNTFSAQPLFYEPFQIVSSQGFDSNKGNKLQTSNH